ncbi:ATP-binding cassette domain-containing protein [Salinicola rhizosphaerae]|uniref:Phosphonates import ATP-binding protein PhnC 1 n=1 Tax=Salinicola rhizosphaerae TaxID=1443141 RepID=A0ABQ3DZ82_9GAMM|nr:ATP-binding cassette domain-containing protein [Salinicola rhizosphaerae]GHB16067.1 phosphonates import ATP-binding protein PhnC 1 [Salinicola rhizosphaerae]
MTLVDFQAVDLGHGDQIVLPALTLSIARGERIALLGQSGAGKSTLLTAIRQQQQDAAAWCPQGHGLVPLLSVYHNVYMGQLERHSALANLRNLLRPDPLAWQAVETLCDELGLEGLIRRPVERLSGGQRQRVAIARAFYQQRELFLGDEPLSSVDPHQALRLLEQIQARHDACVIALHQHRLALSHFDRVIGLRDGRVAIDAPCRELDLARLDALYPDARSADDRGGDAPGEPQAATEFSAATREAGRSAP